MFFKYDRNLLQLYHLRGTVGQSLIEIGKEQH